MRDRQVRINLEMLIILNIIALQFQQDVALGIDVPDGKLDAQKAAELAQRGDLSVHISGARPVTGKSE